MAYFKLSLLTKMYDPNNVNKYIKNVISEFYGNNVDEELKKYERNNNIIPQLSTDIDIDNVYTKTYTYNEKLNIHQQGQADLSFSLDKMILDDDIWKDNPFASKIKSGSQLLLEDKYSNLYLFTVKDVTYNITENNIVYNFSCQDSFSYQLAKQNDGYTIKNDIDSKNFIGALSVDYWAEKIVEECKIAYKYLRLETPLYLCTDGTAINTVVKKSNNKEILKVLKVDYLDTAENADLYETIPFSCSSTTANGALISLGEQIGLSLKTATVLVEPEVSNYITLITYFWFEPSKKDVVSGLQYSPFRNVKTFSLSQKADSLITTLNINSRTLSSEEIITALPTVSPFFMTYFSSAYWKKYSQYYQGMYTNALYGPQFSINLSSNGISYDDEEDWEVLVSHSNNTITFTKQITPQEKALFTLYNIQVYQTQKTRSAITYINNIGDKKVVTSDNSIFKTTVTNNLISITIQNSDFINLAVNDYIEDYEIHVFFKTQYSDEDEVFARIADQLPWLENKLIDFSYFINSGLLSKLQEQDIRVRVYNDLRKVNSDILLNSNAYYSRIHAQTKYLSEMTNNIDAIGAEVSNIVSTYKQKGSNDHYDTNNLIQRWSLLQSNITSTTSNSDIKDSYVLPSFVELYSTTSDYMRKFLNARQRCLKNLYNFSQYFNTPVDAIYKQCTKIDISIIDTEGDDAFNIYRFEPTNKDVYQVLDLDFAKSYPNFFTFDKTYTDLDAKVVNYNNIKLYNNDVQHSLFDKENHLITEDNYQDINIHCYQDILHKSGANDKYDKDKKYLRQIFFLRVGEMVDNLSGVTAETKRQIRKKITANSFHLNITTTHGTRGANSDLYPCHVQLYSKDTNYLIGWKLYEDGCSFSGDKMYLESSSYIEIDDVRYYYMSSGYWALLDKPIYVGQGVFVHDDDTINFKIENNYYADDTIFYQEIDSTQILKSYIYRKKASIEPYIKNSYVRKPITDLTTGNIASNDTIKGFNNPGNYTFSHTNNNDQTIPGVNFIGWGRYTDNTVKGWHIACGIMGIFNPLWWIGSLITSFNLTDKILVQGGYENTTTHELTIYDNDFAPFKNPSTKRYSSYIKEYPLDAIYDSTGTKHVLVTNTNYNNFYCRINEKTSTEGYSLASNGVYSSLDSSLRTAKKDDELYSGFMSDFPTKFFYSTKPLDASTIAYNTPGVAWTFGNVINLSGTISTYKYSQTKTYTYVEYTDIPATSSYLFLEVKANSNYSVPSKNNNPDDLNQYRDYDWIRLGTIKSGEQIHKDYPTNPNNSTSGVTRNVYFYRIIDGVLSDLSTNVTTCINEIWSNTISNKYGVIYDINDLYDAVGIVENLYYIEERVKLSPASLGDGYNIKDHLLDNTYEFYNDKEERVYTINQLFGNLMYKKPQSYTYYLFDRTIPQTIRIYRYNNQSIVPDIISYEIDASVDGNHTGTAPYADFQYNINSTPISYNVTTNGDFWNKFTNAQTGGDTLPLREHAALIESNLQLYWNEAYAASLLCDIFVPDEWRLKQDKVINHFNVVLETSNCITLNTVYIPKIIKTKESQYAITWSNKIPDVENGQLYTYNQLSEKCRIEVDKMLERTQNVSIKDLYFTKIADNISFYTIQSGGSNWETFINQSVGLSIPDYTGWNGIAIMYLTSHFVDAGTSNYELLLQRRDDLWRKFYEEYPYLFLEGSYTSDSATTSEELLTMAKYSFEDQKYPEKSYSISLIDLIQDIETIDNENGTYNPKYYKAPELQIGQGIKISAEDYTRDRDDIYEALSQLLFITDISRDLRNDGNCQLTVNTIKYQDKLIRRLAKLIRNNPLH